MFIEPCIINLEQFFLYKVDPSTKGLSKDILEQVRNLKLDYTNIAL